MDSCAFPCFYGMLVRLMVSLPQPVTETVREVQDIEGNITLVSKTLKGVVSNGFMMGNPVTKVILHGFHLAEESLVRDLLLERFGKTVNFEGKAENPKQDIHIPKDLYLKPPDLSKIR